MIKAVLERRQAARMTRIGVKALIAAGIIALAVLLPQLAHMTYGAQAGIVLLPMYLPGATRRLSAGGTLGALRGGAVAAGELPDHLGGGCTDAGAGPAAVYDGRAGGGCAGDRPVFRPHWSATA